MGIAALVLGIISLLLSFIPVIGILGLGLAIIGLVLGIIDWVQKKKKDEKHGQAIAGVVCSAVAIIIVILYTVLAGILFVNFAENVDTKTVEEFVDSVKNLDEEKVQDFLNSIQELEESNDINFSFDANDITNL